MFVLYMLTKRINQTPPLNLLEKIRCSFRTKTAGRPTHYVMITWASPEQRASTVKRQLAASDDALIAC